MKLSIQLEFKSKADFQEFKSINQNMGGVPRHSHHLSVNESIKFMDTAIRKNCDLEIFKRLVTDLKNNDEINIRNRKKASESNVRILRTRSPDVFTLFPHAKN